jgi:YegS/Rv2252/BmrU family lipid kinase
MLRVIYNPVAGPKAVRKIDSIRVVLTRRGVPHEIVKTVKPGHAMRLAREAALEGHTAVVAVGGDGTVNEVANGLAGSATRLCVVPHGTGNVFAAEAGLPATAEGCVDLLFNGKTVDIPLARAGDRYFVLLASAGFDAEVVERMSQRGKNFLGIGAYFLAGMRHLMRYQPTLWMEFPGKERIEAQAVLVCRGKRYGGKVTLVPDGNLAGHSLRVVALLSKGRMAIVRFALSALLGKAASSPGVLVRETPSVLVRCGIPSAAQVDGDYLGPLPVRFEMTQTVLHVVVPRDFLVRQAI